MLFLTRSGAAHRLPQIRMRANGDHEAMTTRRCVLPSSLALLCAALQLLSAAHHVLARHAVCPEHGELLHESRAAAHADHAPSDVHPDGEALSAAHDPAAAEHAHEHCGVCSSRRDVAIAPAAWAGAWTPAALVTRIDPARAEADLGRAGYDVAPKQSPPV